MTGEGGQDTGRTPRSALSRADVARAGQLLVRMDELALRQRRAISHLASADLDQLVAEQAALEAELRSIFEAPRAGEPAAPSERAELAALAARVRRTCQHNLGLLAHARRSVSLLLGVDEERAAYDRRARRLTARHSGPSRAF